MKFEMPIESVKEYSPEQQELIKEQLGIAELEELDSLLQGTAESEDLNDQEFYKYLAEALQDFRHEEL